MLEKYPSLTQAQVESIPKLTAIPIPPGFGGDIQATSSTTDLQIWNSDAPGAGPIQADEAVDAVP